MFYPIDDDGMVTIVFDCAGCGLKNMDIEFIRYMIDILKDYYPYNLNYILVLDMPWVLNGITFSMIRDLEILMSTFSCLENHQGMAACRRSQENKICQQKHGG